MCRILLKESLDLSINKLTNLSNGGQLKDLNTIQILNLNNNKIKKLPQDIYYLDSLRELNLSSNQIENLPATINKLKKLELLDLSSNKLTNIDQIQMMPCLRVLNISNNKKLRKLPFGLTTCDSLIDIILDINNFDYPSIDVVSLGTFEIIKFLMTNCDSNIEQSKDIKEITERFIAFEAEEVRILYFLYSQFINKNFHLIRNLNVFQRLIIIQRIR